MVDGARDRGDAVGGDSQTLDDLSASVLAEGEDLVGAARRAVVGPAAVVALGREKNSGSSWCWTSLSETTVAAPSTRGIGHRHRVVDDVDAARDVAADQARREAGEGHRQPIASAALSPVR